MGLTGLDLQGYSSIISEQIQQYFIVIKSAFKRFLNWIASKISSDNEIPNDIFDNNNRGGKDLPLPKRVDWERSRPNPVRKTKSVRELAEELGLSHLLSDGDGAKGSKDTWSNTFYDVLTDKKFYITSAVVISLGFAWV